MKYLFYGITIIVFIALFFSYIENGVVTFRNVHLFVGFVACIFLYFIYHFIKSIIFAIKVKRILINNGIKDILIRFEFIGNNRIIAKNENHIYNILLLFKRGYGWRYHFKDKYTLEFYKKTRKVFANSKIIGPIVSNIVETKLVGKKRLKWKDDDLGDSVINIIIIDKEPYLISDSISGEKICTTKLASGILLFDLNSFSNNAEQYLI